MPAIFRTALTSVDPAYELEVQSQTLLKAALLVVETVTKLQGGEIYNKMQKTLSRRERERRKQQAEIEAQKRADLGLDDVKIGGVERVQQRDVFAALDLMSEVMGDDDEFGSAGPELGSAGQEQGDGLRARYERGLRGPAQGFEDIEGLEDFEGFDDVDEFKEEVDIEDEAELEEDDEGRSGQGNKQ